MVVGVSCRPEVCAELAKRPVSLPVPIIMVSAHAEEAVVVKGLDSGADDYITKPFRREEFLARIRAKLQLSANGAVDQVGYGRRLLFSAFNQLPSCSVQDRYGGLTLHWERLACDP